MFRYRKRIFYLAQLRLCATTYLRMINLQAESLHDPFDPRKASAGNFIIGMRAVSQFRQFKSVPRVTELQD